jgi:hypothetical protein
MVGCIKFRIIKFSDFPRVHFQPYMLLNDMSIPTFNAVSHE